jgi:hypothetical protein
MLARKSRNPELMQNLHWQPDALKILFLISASVYHKRVYWGKGGFLQVLPGLK